MTWIQSALTALSVGVSCAAIGCGSTVVPGPPTLPADFTGPGTYTVPAVPTVAFPIAKVHIEQEGGSVSLYYELPAELAGEKTSIDLDGAPDASQTIHFSGTAGTSTCTLTTGLLWCKESLTGIQLAPPPASASAAQQAAAAAFITDPIGVLAVPLPHEEVGSTPPPATNQ